LQLLKGKVVRNEVPDTSGTIGPAEHISGCPISSPKTIRSQKHGKYVVFMFVGSKCCFFIDYL
jgi:hypothetical protein